MVEKITIEVYDESAQEIIKYLEKRIHNQRAELRRLNDIVCELRRDNDAMKTQSSEAFLSSVCKDYKKTWVSVKDHLPPPDVGTVTVLYRSKDGLYRGEDVYDHWRCRWVMHGESVEQWEINSRCWGYDMTEGEIKGG